MENENYEITMTEDNNQDFVDGCYVEEESGSDMASGFALGALAAGGVYLLVKGGKYAYNRWAKPKLAAAKKERERKKAARQIDNVKVAEHDFVDYEDPVEEE